MSRYMANKWLQNYRKRIREDRATHEKSKKKKITNAERQKAYRERLKVKAAAHSEMIYLPIELRGLGGTNIDLTFARHIAVDLLPFDSHIMFENPGTAELAGDLKNGSAHIKTEFESEDIPDLVNVVTNNSAATVPIYEYHDATIAIKWEPLQIKDEYTSDGEPQEENNVPNSEHHSTSTSKHILYQCLVCFKQYSDKRKLRAHITCYHYSKVTGTKPFKCHICSKRFYVKKYLSRHVRIHTGEKPYNCDMCDRKYNRRDVLTAHKRTHSGEKPYVCDICRKRFNMKKLLTQHITTHTGEKPYECNICHIGFTQRVKLTLHMRSHTGRKPYKCDVCHNRFSRKDNLSSHKRTHTGTKPFECDICHNRFSRKDNRTAHMRRMHAGQK